MGLTGISNAISSVSNGRRDTVTDSSKKVRNVGFEGKA